MSVLIFNSESFMNAMSKKGFVDCGARNVLPTIQQKKMGICIIKKQDASLEISLIHLFPIQQNIWIQKREEKKTFHMST